MQHVNIWEITVYLREGGSLQIVGADRRNQEIARVSLKKLMVNYFSVGVDAQIGLEFDRRRTKSKCCNNCVYGCQGLKKCCCGCNTSLKRVIDYMAREGAEAGDSRVLFASDHGTDADQYLRGKPVSLICTNIDSYMGGRANPWAKRKKKTGLESADGTTILNDFSGVQRYDDGLLEFCAIYSVFGMATQQFIRVAQAEGPFVLKFRDTPGLETFLNIDGEYFRLLQPDRLVVKLCSALQDGRLKALMRQK